MLSGPKKIWPDPIQTQKWNDLGPFSRQKLTAGPKPKSDRFGSDFSAIIPMGFLKPGCPPLESWKGDQFRTNPYNHIIPYHIVGYIMYYNVIYIYTIHVRAFYHSIKTVW